MMMYRVIYNGTFSIPGADDACVITLTDGGETRALSVVTEKSMATEIRMHERKSRENETHLVDVMLGLLREQDETARYRIVIKGVPEIGLKASLVNVSNDKSYDLRMDEAVLLSLAGGFEMCATLDVFQNFSTPFNKDVLSVALPIVGLPEPLLEQALQKAVEEENYEGASFIRDEMKRRKEKNGPRNLDLEK